MQKSHLLNRHCYNANQNKDNQIINKAIYTSLYRHNILSELAVVHARSFLKSQWFTIDVTILIRIPNLQIHMHTQTKPRQPCETQHCHPVNHACALLKTHRPPLGTLMYNYIVYLNLPVPALVACRKVSHRKDPKSIHHKAFASTANTWPPVLIIQCGTPEQLM